MCVGNTHPWDIYPCDTGTVLAAPVFTSLNEETRKKQIKSAIHLITCKNGEVFFGFFTEQYSLVCQKFRWCLSSLTSDISEKSFWKDESFKFRRRWFTDCFNLVCMAHPDSIPLSALLDPLTPWGYARLVSTNVFVRAVRDVVNCHTCITGFKEG